MSVKPTFNATAAVRLLMIATVPQWLFLQLCAGVCPAHLQLVHDVEACCSCITGCLDEVEQLSAGRTTHQQGGSAQPQRSRKAASSSSRGSMASVLAECSMHEAWCSLRAQCAHCGVNFYQAARRNSGGRALTNWLAFAL
jgi:hypothetical protein